MQKPTPLLERPGFRRGSLRDGHGQVGADFLPFREHHLVDRMEVVAEPLKHAVGQAGLPLPAVDLEHGVFGEIDLGQERGRFHLGLTVDEGDQFRRRGKGILNENRVAAQPDDLLHLGTKALVAGDGRLLLVGRPDKEIEIGADALRPPDRRADRVEGQDLAILPLLLPGLRVGEPAVLPAAAVEVGGIFGPDEKRAALAGRGCDRLDAADRRKRLLSQPSS